MDYATAEVGAVEAPHSGVLNPSKRWRLHQIRTLSSWLARDPNATDVRKLLMWLRAHPKSPGLNGLKWLRFMRRHQPLDCSVCGAHAHYKVGQKGYCGKHQHQAVSRRQIFSQLTTLENDLRGEKFIERDRLAKGNRLTVKGWRVK